MTILLLISLGLNAVFIRSYIEREQRRRNREHERYKRQFAADLKRINVDWNPKLLEARKGQNT